MAKLSLYESFTNNSWVNSKKRKGSLREDSDKNIFLNKKDADEFLQLLSKPVDYNTLSHYYDTDSLWNSLNEYGVLKDEDVRSEFLGCMSRDLEPHSSSMKGINWNKRNKDVVNYIIPKLKSIGREKLGLKNSFKWFRNMGEDLEMDEQDKQEVLRGLTKDINYITAINKRYKTQELQDLKDVSLLLNNVLSKLNSIKSNLE